MLVEVQNSGARDCAEKKDILSGHKPLTGGHMLVEGLLCYLTWKLPFFLMAKGKMRKRMSAQGC